MSLPLRSRQSVIIDAPLHAVWEYNSDLSRIPDFHPRVTQVELIDGRSQRAAGVAYKCHLRGGRHTCIERDVEVVPMERIVTTLAEDSFGVARLLPDYRVESTLQREGAGRTRVEFRHYYSIRGWRARLFHWIAGPDKGVGSLFKNQPKGNMSATQKNFPPLPQAALALMPMNFSPARQSIGPAWEITPALV